MAWDNIISRGVWIIIQPSNFLIISLTVSLLIIQFRKPNSRLIKPAKKILVTTVIVLFATSFTNLSTWIMIPLEKRFDSYRNNLSNIPYGGIIILAGSENTSVSTKTRQANLRDSGDRLSGTLALANKFPALTIVHSGGAQKRKTDWTENEVAGKFFEDSAIDLTRIIFETNSYNTHTNATETAKIVGQDNNLPWLLVTSAFHMPRSVGAFKNAGVNIQPYPVDYKTILEYRGIFSFDAASNLRRLDLAIHEYVGLFAYYVTGRSSAFFPSPEN